jgi:SAM-dependent methyltransferase
MWRDVIDLRDFYATPLGQTARRMIRRRLRAFWPDVAGSNILGLGYATPYLGAFRHEAERVVAAMPAAQGVLHWPGEGPGLTLLTDDVELPFDDLSVDRVLLVHSLECAEQVRPMMREIWRVMSGGGRLLVVAPNRRGIWAQFERNPFGHGQPYSPRQISQLLRDTMFTPLRTHTALFVPPVRSRMMVASAPALEEIGRRGLAHFGGVVLAEAEKQTYAAHAQTSQRTRRAYIPLPQRRRETPSPG